MKYFGIHAFYAGCINYHDSLWQYVDQPDLFFNMESARPIMAEIEIIAQNLLQNKQLKLSEISREVQQ